MSHLTVRANRPTYIFGKKKHVKENKPNVANKKMFNCELLE